MCLNKIAMPTPINCWNSRFKRQMKSKTKPSQMKLDMIKTSDKLVALHTGFLTSYALPVRVCTGFGYCHSCDILGYSICKTWECLQEETRTWQRDGSPGWTSGCLETACIWHFYFEYTLSNTTMSMWLPLQSKELKGLITYWPSRQEITTLCYPECYRKWFGITAI